MRILLPLLTNKHSILSTLNQNINAKCAINHNSPLEDLNVFCCLHVQTTKNKREKTSELKTHIEDQHCLFVKM